MINILNGWKLFTLLGLIKVRSYGGRIWQHVWEMVGGALIYEGGESCNTKLVVAIRDELTMNIFFFCLGLLHQAEKENICSKLVPGCDSEFVVL